MIHSVKLVDTPAHEFNFLNEESRDKQVRNLILKLEEGITFKTGVNVIIGENGSGKSTLLNVIKSANLLKHSFIPKKEFLPRTTIDGLIDVYDSFEIKQDLGYFTANLYRMSEDAHKLASNDLEDGKEALQFIDIHRKSKGQNVLGDISQLWNQIFEHTNECFPVLKHVKDLKDVDGAEELIKNMLKMHAPTESQPIITVLMDEPDQGLDIDNLKSIYEILSTTRVDTQLIAVVHNPVLIYKLAKLPLVNFIEMSEGYLDKVVNFIRGE